MTRDWLILIAGAVVGGAIGAFLGSGAAPILAAKIVGLAIFGALVAYGGANILMMLTR